MPANRDGSKIDAASGHDISSSPVTASRALRLVHDILKNGQIAWTGHATKALEDDAMQTTDAMNVLRCGNIREPGELEHGTYRYRVHTDRMCVVVSFRSEREFVVVTAWRKKR